LVLDGPLFLSCEVLGGFLLEFGSSGTIKVGLVVNVWIMWRLEWYGSWISSVDFNFEILVVPVGFGTLHWLQPSTSSSLARYILIGVGLLVSWVDFNFEILVAPVEELYTGCDYPGSSLDPLLAASSCVFLWMLWCGC